MTKLTADDFKLLGQFYSRRAWFDKFLSSAGLENTYTCPSCGFPSLSERSQYGICGICNWEDDGQDDPDQHVVFGGPNHNLSLTESRLSFAIDLKAILEAPEHILLKDPEQLTESVTKLLSSMDDAYSVISSSNLTDEEWTHYLGIRRSIRDQMLFELLK